MTGIHSDDAAAPCRPRPAHTSSNSRTNNPANNATQLQLCARRTRPAGYSQRGPVLQPRCKPRQGWCTAAPASHTCCHKSATKHRNTSLVHTIVTRAQKPPGCASPLLSQPMQAADRSPSHKKGPASVLNAPRYQPGSTNPCSNNLCHKRSICRALLAPPQHSKNLQHDTV